MAKAQAQDKELLHFLNTDHLLKIKQVPVAVTDLTLICDESLPEKLRPFVLQRYRHTIINNIHNLSHSGVRSTARMISDPQLWPDLNNNVVVWCRNCIDCRKTKVRRHNITNLQRYPHKNLFTQTCILVIVDRFFRWPVAAPLLDSRTQTILNAFMHSWLLHYGVPGKLTTYRGSQFLSQEWDEAMKFLGIYYIHTTVYRPQSNALAEKNIQTIKKALKTLIQDKDWYFLLVVDYASFAITN